MNNISNYKCLNQTHSEYSPLLTFAVCRQTHMKEISEITQLHYLLFHLAHTLMCVGSLMQHKESIKRHTHLRCSLTHLILLIMRCYKQKIDSAAHLYLPLIQLLKFPLSPLSVLLNIVYEQHLFLRAYLLLHRHAVLFSKVNCNVKF